MSLSTTSRPTLVADIGGTNTRVALAEADVVLRDTVRRYANKDHGGMDEVLSLYLSETGVSEVGAACVALAGPVVDGVGRMTNLDWTLSLEELSTLAGTKNVRLINDLQAQGFAIGHVPPAHVKTIMSAGNPKDGVKLALNIGTGFNVAPVYDTPTGRIVAPAEAGGMRLPARNAIEAGLVDFLDTTTGFAAIEEALSGRGLSQIYQYLSGSDSSDETAKVPTPAEVTTAALAQSDDIAVQSFELFLALTARISGDFALSYQPFGGIYLVGGVAQKIASHLQTDRFAAYFNDKGRYQSLLGGISVYAICDDFAALTGCATAMTPV